VKEAVILCGGDAWRLKPYTYTPKPLIDLGGKTLVDWQIDWLTSYGFDRIILASNQTNLTKRAVTYSVEEKKLGTGGAVFKAFNEAVVGDKAYVMNVDDLLLDGYDPKTLLEFPSAIVTGCPTLPYGVVDVDKAGFIVGFKQKPLLSNVSVCIGHYCFSKQVVERFFPAKGDFESEALQKIADQGFLKAVPYKGRWITINTLKELISAQRIFKDMHGEQGRKT